MFFFCHSVLRTMVVSGSDVIRPSGSKTKTAKIFKTQNQDGFLYKTVFLLQTKIALLKKFIDLKIILYLYQDLNFYELEITALVLKKFS